MVFAILPEQAGFPKAKSGGCWHVVALYIPHTDWLLPLSLPYSYRRSPILGAKSSVTELFRCAFDLLN